MPRIQFSLRLFLVICVVLGISLAMVIRSYQSYYQTQESIQSVTQQYQSNSDGLIQLKSYYNHYGQPVAFLFWVNTFDDELACMTHTYGYARETGGTLLVNGTKVDPKKGPWLIVNGPYGLAVHIQINEAQAKSLTALQEQGFKKQAAETLWQQLVEPRLYTTEGQSSGGVREGKWVFRLSNGDKYVEGEYRNGARDGEWLTYYPNKQVRSRRFFDLGTRAGTWTIYDEQGQTIATAMAGRFRYDTGTVRDHLVIEGKSVPVPQLPDDVATWLSKK